ncbi:hypothetical protein ACNF42_06880 [Cuniculiplasma sp. SKW3]|uniref:hypothetical protein n=1 Tax=Cuniculiplasma sp. SKW3 TaxID=3400170 RepID=UPI003FCF4B14
MNEIEEFDLWEIQGQFESVDFKPTDYIELSQLRAENIIFPADRPDDDEEENDDE